AAQAPCRAHALAFVYLAQTIHALLADRALGSGPHSNGSNCDFNQGLCHCFVSALPSSGAAGRLETSRAHKAERSCLRTHALSHSGLLAVPGHLSTFLAI